MKFNKKFFRRACGVLCVLAFIAVLGAVGAMDSGSLPPGIGFRRVGLWLGAFGVTSRVFWG